jgi:predicted ATPase/Tfp pilus assembly protein PilF
VTLTGPGGIGKTRLALQVAADALDAFPDGAWLVDLAPVRDPGLVAAAIAALLGVREEAGRPLAESLAGYLRDRRLLLVLDNFEQVIEGAPLVAELLAAAPGLKVLATSRALLRLRGEHEVVVLPLALPERPEGARMPEPLEILTQYAAVRLFIARAAEARPGFAVDNETAPAVAEICHRLDGLPLAIELAAARAKLFGPTALLLRLERRLPFLTGGARDLPARQRTLRDTIAWSHDLLSPEEQTLFRRLAVFAGGFTLEAAEAVCNPDGDLGLDVLDELIRLGEHSLLRQAEQSDGEPRFGMLETIREFALEQLAASGEESAVRAEHAAHYLALAEAAEPALRGPDQVAWLDRLEAEHANFRAALDWAEGAEGDLALRLANLLVLFWDVRGHLSEGRARLERVLARHSDAPTALRANALDRAGILAQSQGDPRHAVVRHEEALALRREIGEQRGLGGTLNNLAVVVRDQGDPARAEALFAESLALFRQAGDDSRVAYVLHNLAGLGRDRGDIDRAAALYEESLALKRRAGDQRGIATTLNDLALVAEDQGDYAKATLLLEESLELKRLLGDRWGVASSLTNLGNVALYTGDPDRAAALYEESLALWRELGNRWGIAFALNSLGLAARERGDATGAEGLFGEALDIRRELGTPRDIAISLRNLGDLARQQGHPERAAALLRASLALFRTPADRDMLVGCLEAVADLAIGGGRPREATRLAAAAARESGVGGTPPTLGGQAKDEQRLATLRDRLGDAAFDHEWEAGGALTLEQAVAEALKVVADDA